VQLLWENIIYQRRGSGGYQWSGVAAEAGYHRPVVSHLRQLAAEKPSRLTISMRPWLLWKCQLYRKWRWHFIAVAAAASAYGVASRASGAQLPRIFGCWNTAEEKARGCENLRRMRRLRKQNIGVRNTYCNVSWPVVVAVMVISSRWWRMSSAIFPLLFRVGWRLYHWNVNPSSKKIWKRSSVCGEK